MTDAPTGSNADEWALFLSEWGVAYCAVQIAEALEAAEQRGYAWGIEAAVKKCRGKWKKYRDFADVEPHNAQYQRDRAMAIMAETLGTEIETLSPTPPAPAAVQEAARVAVLFHEAYEKLAPNFGYETRPDTKVFDPESANGRLMIATCGEVLRALAEQEGE